ncbi:MAG: menaquinone biosynthesis protein [Victivallaceae bacterium]|nr:menaquinone biosynthesis protein [Victivallaceae bacterium]
MKIGIIKYINSIPLSHGIEKYGEVIRDTPRNLANQFFDGKLDFSFIPAVEYIRMENYCSLVPGVTISSFGTTDSVTLFYNGSVRQIKKVKLSNESRTSNFLVRELLEHHYQLNVRYIEHGSCDAEVIIGDKALISHHRRYADKIDIGQAWLEMTGLPVVYAVCVGHNQHDAQHFAQIINKLTADNLAHLEHILAELGADRYCQYIKNLNYSFETPHQKSLAYMSRLYQDRYVTKRSRQLVHCQ